ncbi:MAG: class II aldolase/adducin family protein [Candidatus Marinimicrobia bacterium]|nr:class II aldolase/adducin family protein [Candidatus Neomarinimicrobiota bacterium]MCF7828312.1 class II aldolase/adducin family protein [Candidatus Neomarinimicrobiota bacterium]MCF7879513.1 class II aldolase/adducin family protein [Candidatus Neomarinimicrobiota bacterium]
MSHQLGNPAHRFTILGEGNSSAQLDENLFLVRASGTELRTLQPEHLVATRFETTLSLLDNNASEEETEVTLLESRNDPKALKPSVESTFHAWLLRQPGVNFVGHTHPIEVNKILCSPAAKLFASRRLFPDEIVCCGPKSLLLDYVNPGADLAIAIRNSWDQFIRDNGFTPKILLIKNHGLIAVGETANGVLSATQMANKAAAVFNGAAIHGKIQFMTPGEVEKIHNRLDEKYRQQQIRKQT